MTNFVSKISFFHNEEFVVVCKVKMKTRRLDKLVETNILQ